MLDGVYRTITNKTTNHKYVEMKLTHLAGEEATDSSAVDSDGRKREVPRSAAGLPRLAPR